VARFTDKELSMTSTRSANPDATPEHIERLAEDFDQHGFVHIPQLLSERQLIELRMAATETAATKHVEAAGIIATVDAWEHNPTVRRLALDPRLGSIAEHPAGMLLRVWGGEILVKTPNGERPTGLHDDQPCEVLDSRITLTAWIALVDVPVERGALTFLPGSHRRGGPERIDTAEFDFDDAVQDEQRSYLFGYWPELEWMPRITVPLRAGDATIHHRRTAHSAGANHTADDRVSVVITYTDADATYKPRAGHDPLPYRPGQPLPDDRYPRVAASA
jgi:ectoine hydroxylase-related dioxygenase (phytanoyl-CoA dioxygenase family)